LNGYGAYGEPISLKYDPSAVSLVDRGVVLAYAHIRGGGELGQKWYHLGRQALKSSSIEDFLACAKTLKSSTALADSFAGGGYITAKAFSAGGIVVQGAINQDPTSFDKVVMTNAFVDLFATMSNPNLFLTEHEYDEFGDPREDGGKSIQSLCPFSNLIPGATYPKYLITGAMDDAQVPFHNAVILAEKLRQCALEGRQDRIMLHVESAGGHHLSGIRREVSALENCFILEDPNSL
jgi:oligopeptidase B